MTTLVNSFSSLGVNVVIKHHTRSAIKRYVQAIVDLGCRWVRLKLAFNRLSPCSLEWRWVDQFINDCVSKKVQILGLLSPYIPGTLSNLVWPRRTNQPVFKQLDAYNRYLETCLKRYHSIIKHWEVWNEPNTFRFWISPPNAQEYVRLLRLTQQYIRSFDESSQIVFGGLSALDSKLLPFTVNQEAFYQQVLDLGAGAYFDIANTHPYTSHCYVSWQSPQTLLVTLPAMVAKTVKRFQKLSPVHPVWITEFGISSTWVRRLKPTDIGQIYYRCFATAAKLKVPLALWTLTDFADPHYFPGNPERAFGLLDWQLNPKPAYFHLQMLLNASG